MPKVARLRVRQRALVTTCTLRAICERPWMRVKRRVMGARAKIILIHLHVFNEERTAKRTGKKFCERWMVSPLIEFAELRLLCRWVFYYYYLIITWTLLSLSRRQLVV